MNNKRNDLYSDWFCVVGIKDDNKIGFYASMPDYIEMSVVVAKYIARRMHEDIKKGLRLVDYLYELKRR